MGTVTTLHRSDERAHAAYVERMAPWLCQAVGEIIGVTEPLSDARRAALRVAFDAAGRGPRHERLRREWTQ